MCAQSQTYGARSRKVSILVSLLTISLFFSFNFTGFADPTPAFKLDPVNWVRGPARASLGDCAEINIPAGYRFANTEDARTLLRLMNNPAPEALAGILAPDNGKGMVVFEYTAIGYVKETGKDHLNPPALLVKLEDKVRRQNQQAAKDGNVAPPIDSIGWAMEPVYDGESHTMEWAIRAQSGGTRAVNHVVRMLGREGVLDGIAVQTEQRAADPVPLKELMGGVTFKTGHTYADFQKGDRISKHDLADMITAELSEKDKTFSLGLILAISGGFAVVLGGAIVWVVVRERRKMRIRRERMPAKQTGALAGFPTPGYTNGAAKTLLKAAVTTVKENNNHANGKQNGNGKIRRRRIFDYQKYYSDLLFQVSDRAYEVDVLAPARNGSAVPHASRNGAQLQNQNHSEDNALAARLIESQKHLIEEQQRLIREQTKLIEEKTKLIQEKNQVLEKQAELFGNNVF